jgi:hypothetical protein
MTATPTAVAVLALFAPPSCGPVATSAGPPLAWGTSGNALARRVPGGQGGRADPRRGHQREQGGSGWADAGRWDCVKSGFIFPILPLCARLLCAAQSAPEPGGARRCIAVLVLDRRRRMGEGSAQRCPGVKAAREAGATAGLTAVEGYGALSAAVAGQECPGGRIACCRRGCGPNGETGSWPRFSAAHRG